MTQAAAPTSAPLTPPRLPPPRLMRVFNVLTKAILRLPMHKGMSSVLLILEYTGRKSGKRYSTPVGYIRDGNTVYCFTSSGWARNFDTPAPVKVRVAGVDYEATAHTIREPASVIAIMRKYAAQYGWSMRVGTPVIEQPPTDAQLTDFIRTYKRAAVEIQLK